MCVRRELFCVEWNALCSVKPLVGVLLAPMTVFHDFHDDNVLGCRSNVSALSDRPPVSTDGLESLLRGAVPVGSYDVVAGSGSRAVIDLTCI